MKPIGFSAAAAVALLAQPVACLAYEFATHAAMSREAFHRSNLAQPNFLIGRGIPETLEALGSNYIDFYRTTQVVRSAMPKDSPDFGLAKIDLANRSADPAKLPVRHSVVGWLMLGAIREDDVPFDRGAVENTPQDDPAGATVRVQNHFFDPYHNAAFIGARASDWALGTPSTSTENHFDLAAVREAHWRAATLKQINADKTLSDVPVPPALQYLGILGIERSREELSKTYWATTFRALGDVVHLLQDMAQPQHTRGDPHAGLGCSWSSCVLGHQSYYESYVEARVTRNASFTLRERYFQWQQPTDLSDTVRLTPVDYGSYPVPRFAAPRAYFASAIGNASTSAAGLANYSNQGFFSAGTNLGSGASSFLSPTPNEAAFATVTIPSGSVENATGELIGSGALRLKTGVVADYNVGAFTATNVRLSSFGPFDDRLRLKGKSGFTLNHYNYADQAKLLVPRAVSYSAGLLDYYFRGELQLGMPSSGVYGVVTQSGCASTCGFNKLRVLVTNTTVNDAFGAGLLVAVVRFNKTSAYSTDLSSLPGAPSFPGFASRSVYREMLVSNPVSMAALGGSLPAMASSEVQFDFPNALPINATDVALQVVFRGALGAEPDAVVIGSKDISEPTFHGFANISDYVWDGPAKKFWPVPVGQYITTDDTLNIKLRFGSATAPVVASIPKLSAGQHAQIATLTDVTPQTMYVESKSANWVNFSPIPAGFTPVQFYSPPNTTVYDANLKVALHRGVYRQNYYFWGLPADNTIYTCTPTDEHCLQATLPALTPAKAVPWTITF